MKNAHLPDNFHKLWYSNSRTLASYKPHRKAQLDGEVLEDMDTFSDPNGVNFEM
jgi:hypothetical protein